MLDDLGDYFVKGGGTVAFHDDAIDLFNKNISKSSFFLDVNIEFHLLKINQSLEYSMVCRIKIYSGDTTKEFLKIKDLSNRR